MLIKNKKIFIITLCIVTVLNAMINYYVTNLLLSDLGNMFYGVQDNLIISSLPGFLFSVEITMMLIMLVRIYNHKDLVINYLKFYAPMMLLISIFGVVFTIKTSIEIYDGIFASYPFPGYLFICLLLHLGMIAYSTYCIIKYWKEKFKVNNEVFFSTIIEYVFYGLYSLMMGIGVYFALNRFGAFLLSPVYLQWRTLDLTWPFYLSLCLPLLLILAILIKYFYGPEQATKKFKIIVFSGITVINLGLCLACYFIGKANPIYLSAISPACGLERLATAPYITIIQIILLSIIPLYQLIKVIFNVEKKIFRQVNQ